MAEKPDSGSNSFAQGVADAKADNPGANAGSAADKGAYDKGVNSYYDRQIDNHGSRK